MEKQLFSKNSGKVFPKIERKTGNKVAHFNT